MEPFKTFEENRNGMVMGIDQNGLPIGMHEQNTNPYEPFSTGEEQRTGPTSGKLFPNGSAPNVGGTINKNGEYGPISYGY